MNSNEAIAIAAAAVAGAAAIFYLARKKPSESAAAPTKLSLYGFCPLEPDADSSPACLKLATFLRMCNADYDHRYFADHAGKGWPKGKMPWIHWDKINGGEPMGDSTLIINALIRLDPTKFDLDKHLTKEERAVGLAIKTMCEESMYFTGVLSIRWLDIDQFWNVSSMTYFGKDSALYRYIVSKVLLNKLTRDAKGQGTGLLTYEERKEKFFMELNALADFLGNEKKYIMGNELTSYDATVYAWLVILTQGTWENEMRDKVREKKNLMDYMNRMRNEVWPER